MKFSILDLAVRSSGLSDLALQEALTEFRNAKKKEQSEKFVKVLRLLK